MGNEHFAISLSLFWLINFSELSLTSVPVPLENFFSKLPAELKSTDGILLCWLAIQKVKRFNKMSLILIGRREKISKAFRLNPTTVFKNDEGPLDGPGNSLQVLRTKPDQGMIKTLGR